MANWKLSGESRDKIKDVLSSVLGSALQYGLVVKNPVEGVRLPPDRIGRHRSKPFLTPAQFKELVTRIQKPYASMLFVGIYTSLRAGIRDEPDSTQSRGVISTLGGISGLNVVRLFRK